MLVGGHTGTGDSVTSAIRSASRTTGAAFDYLLNTAIRESSLDPAAKAKTSSARGLYQFIESTWLSMIKEEGPKYGLANYASAIERGANGEYTVRDPIARSHILKLRENAEISSVMAGALAKRNAADLTQSLGRKPTAGEVYLAHFLGASGAKRLITLQQTNPGAPAAAAFPEAARANQAIFRDGNGKARSAVEVFTSLTARHDTRLLRTVPAAKSMAVAELRPTLSADPVSAPLRAPAAQKVTFEHPLIPGRSAFAAEEGPAFQALFRNGLQTKTALSPAVRELWGAYGAQPRRIADIGSKAAAPGAIGEPMDLLGHLKPGVLQSGRRTTLGS